MAQSDWRSVSYALSDDDLHSLLPGVPITMYSDVDERRLSQMLDTQGRGLLLFKAEETPSTIVGHWLALATQPEGLLVFDPYGGSREPWYLNHTFVSNKTLKSLDQDAPELVQTIRDAGLQPIYSTKRYQKMSPKINTCGRHCVVRLWNKHLDNDAYESYISAQPDTPDQAVTRLTNVKLQSYKS